MLQEASERSSKRVPGTLADIDVEQAGAVCLRRTNRGAVQVLLVSSKRNGHWGLPKGHIEPGETSSVTAEREAFEEAGARGIVTEEPFGSFTYVKDNNLRRYRVTAHLIEVQSMARSYPEKGTRKLRWFSLDDAVAEAGQPGLRMLLQKLR
ncbi:NUDIX hydrolase (plasmid) [Rhizobium sp. CB3090]|uniref:NUDIX hydrolase n=1 Tax=Rhizobium sp. CB3090 TaxID=3039156 RepID=UPI0024B268F7|nr:NUDIX hydrolase [Rhizobium sp. CB3090]WFU11945.1 NUDIX hydrolase [Rhizobium sp. CB3090]